MRRHGFLMDGFPRTVEQAEGFAEIVGAETLCSRDPDRRCPPTWCSPGSSVAGCAPRAARRHRRRREVARSRARVETDGRCAARTTPRPRSVAASSCTTMNRATSWKWFDERGLLLTVDGAASPDAVYDATLAALRPALWGDRLSCRVTGGCARCRRQRLRARRRLRRAPPAIALFSSRLRVGICGSIFSSASTSSSATATVRTHLRSDGHHEPRRPLRRGLGDRLLVGLLVLVPERAVVEVGEAELPTLLRVVDAGLEALALLVRGDVQEHLHDGRAFVHEHPLELADVAEPRPPDRSGASSAPARRARPRSASG